MQNLKYDQPCEEPLKKPCHNVGRFKYENKLYCGMHYPPNVEKRKKGVDRAKVEKLRQLQAQLRLTNLQGEIAELVVVEDYAGVAAKRPQLLELLGIVKGED